MSPCSVPEKLENMYFQCYAYCKSLSAKLPSQGETDFVEEFIFNLNPQTLSKILKGGSEGPIKKPKRQERSSYINHKTPDYLPCYAEECEEKCGRNKVHRSLTSVRLHSRRGPWMTETLFKNLFFCFRELQLSKQ